MKYDPFTRGQYPVGVRTMELADPARAGRALSVEIWYPAAARHRGHDLEPSGQDVFAIFGLHRVRQAAVRDAEPAAVPCPLLVFSHGLAGHRRQSTFLCTHLASHGYMVAAPDHGGSTLADLIALAMRIGHGALPAEAEAELLSHVLDCPRDVRFLLGALRAHDVVPLTDTAGVLGHSFGGFTALAVASDASVHAVAALAPAGGAGPLESALLTRGLALDWPAQQVATLFLALERDSVLPLAGIEGLYRRTPPPARMFVLQGGDHMHLCDRAASSHEFFRRVPPVGVFAELLRRMPPFTELVPEEHGYAFANALCLAHFDAALRGVPDAASLLERAVSAFADHGVAVRALD
jgi:dienelactone hydrolase